MWSLSLCVVLKMYVLSLLVLFTGNSGGIFDVLHSVVQSLTGFCGAGWPWGNNYG